ncbi:MAG: hypothetical protein KDA59_24200 [Planctomycetales bacterium]|nr:hypothetical protein [Planctomycetales bacterium]
MKSPADLQLRLRRQWNNADLRTSRLLGEGVELPIELSIGLPTPTDLLSRLEQVKQHVEQWRKVRIGEVVWTDRSYRSASESIRVPRCWRIHEPSQWSAACNDVEITNEFNRLTELFATCDPVFHEVIARRRSLTCNRAVEEVAQACRVAMNIQPGDADGRPLRLLSEFGTDTKFFERNRSLLLTLLDQRFDGEASRLGLESFLDAATEGEHWLLVHELERGLLPFPQLRVRGSDLFSRSLPGRHLLIIENENCHHLLPEVRGAVAVLGSGFNVGWTSAPWLVDRPVAYWGDIDTWGLRILSDVRRALPHVQSLLMDRGTFEHNIDKAVAEPTPASLTPPEFLNSPETLLYLRLLESQRGRLEQEFIDARTVQQAILDWATQAATEHFAEHRQFD